MSVLDGRSHAPAAPLLDWMRRNAPLLHLSVITLTELEAGVRKIERRGPSIRASDLRTFVTVVTTVFGDRLLPVTREVALGAARIAETALPVQPEIHDLLIAATADFHDLIFLTRNLRHFRPMGVECIDPFAFLPPDA